MRAYELDVATASAAVRAGELSPLELAESVLARIEQMDPLLGAYVTVSAARARESARRAGEEHAAGRLRGPLHGVPMALKDLIDVAGLPTTASSRVREGHVAKADSTVAARLAEAGTALLGKTHTHEFAYGLTTPQTRNARDCERVAGGSSGGSAVAVAAGAAPFALGTDTGGSIRVPAALNGVVGLKPTYGRVPREGVTPLSWSLDHVGPITRTVRDAELVLAALDAPNRRNHASVSGPGDGGPVSEEGAVSGLRGVRVGVPRNYYFEHVDLEVETAVRRAVAGLEAMGAELVDVEIPMARYVQAVQWGLMVPEATAVHERTLRETPELYTPEVRVLLEAGVTVPAVDHLRARRARALMREEWTRLFESVDVIAAPTVPAAAARVGQSAFTWADGSTESVSDAYVRLSAPANITGVPALTVPAGHDRDGLPIGLQLMARPWGETELLRVGRAHEVANSEAGERGSVIAEPVAGVA
ncbi:amidase [Streptomyces sp. HNM0574]|uniref:amidase n=1 Tax=Streptomyces sp. HNM0574 TaxID=2714954 RepID=UPI001469B924|nr:amidase [Streptomyces sp. HNM0574]NLU68334.1 amidase [Streptomyces sp. HNM0574]